MCYKVSNSKIDIFLAVEQLQAEYQQHEYALGSDINAFARPILPVIAEENGRKLEPALWKLTPPKPGEPPTKGLNLQAENSWKFYKNVQHNRCVIPVNAFYEYKHYPSGGKKDITALHRLTWKEQNQFYLAGYYNRWEDGTLGFGLVTGPANELLTDVHNVEYDDPKRKKGRMPISFDAGMAIRFLEDEQIEDFMFPAYDPVLEAENLEPHKVPNTLF